MIKETIMFNRGAIKSDEVYQAPAHNGNYYEGMYENHTTDYSSDYNQAKAKIELFRSKALDQKYFIGKKVFVLENDTLNLDTVGVIKQYESSVFLCFDKSSDHATNEPKIFLIEFENPERPNFPISKRFKLSEIVLAEEELGENQLVRGC